jgi:hypothetical protein
MVIVSSFKLKYNKKTGLYTVISAESTDCPLCNGFLNYRDNKKRQSKNLSGKKRILSLRRLKCEICGKLHIELPDIIQPHKHYDSDTIQCVLDGSKEAERCVADNSTIYRWQITFRNEESDIVQRLSAVYAQEMDEKVPLIAPERILSSIKDLHKRWLAFVMWLLINSGYKICTQFAFCPSSPSAKMAIGTKNKAKGGEKGDKTPKDTG